MLPNSRKFLGLIFTLGSLEALFCLFLLSRISHDPANEFFFGFSLPRLVVFLVLISGFLADIFLLIINWRKSNFSETIQKWMSHKIIFIDPILIGSFFSLLGIMICLTSSSSLGNFSDKFTRLYPAILWLTLVFVQVTLFIIFSRYTIHIRDIHVYLQENHIVRNLSIFWTFAFVIFWFFILITGLGILPDPAYWNEVGVPIFFWQIVVSLVFAIILTWLSDRILVRHPSLQKRLFGKSGIEIIDLVIIIILWLVSFLVWNSQPLQRSYFLPGPYLPDNQFFPFSDAAYHDITGQFVLLGQGLYNHGNADKPLYSLFLAIAHLIGGQNYNQAIAVQVFFLALLSPLVYFLGKQLHSRLVGILSALFVLFEIVNMFPACLYIQVPHVKLMMSEIPCGLLLACFTISATACFSKAGNIYKNAALAGGFLGAATFVRHNPWLFLPFFVFIAFLYFGKSKQILVRTITIFCLVFFLTILPFSIRNFLTNGSFFDVVSLAQSVVWRGRYQPTATVTTTPALISTQSSTISGNIQPKITAIPVLVAENTPTPPVTNTQTASIQTSGLMRFTLPKILEVPETVAAHFIHNLITSFLILPTSLTSQDSNTIYRSPNSLWNQKWSGALPPYSFILVIFNIFIFSIGLAAAQRHWHKAGIFPFLVFLIYNLSTAVAHTSGGRYIVPVIWVVLLYFAIGCVEFGYFILSLFGIKNNKKIDNIGGNKNESTSIRSTLPVVLIFFLIGITLPASEWIFPQINPIYTEEQMLNQISSSPDFSKLDYSQAQLDQYKRSPGSLIISGKMLFPRFYSSTEGEPDNNNVYKNMPFSRLVFTLLSPIGEKDFILPLKNISSSSLNYSDVIVLGCTGSDPQSLNALLVFVKTSSGNSFFIQRQPSTNLLCPALPPQ
jgi:hypothetical protein